MKIWKMCEEKYQYQRPEQAIRLIQEAMMMMMMRCCGDLNKEKPRLDIVRKIAEIDYLE
jgi:hypothetical protein